MGREREEQKHLSRRRPIKSRTFSPASADGLQAEDFDSRISSSTIAPTRSMLSTQITAFITAKLAERIYSRPVALSFSPT